MAAKKQIKYLPEGWEWRYKGEQTFTFTDAKGIVHSSDERHGYNTKTGDYLSTRQIQKRQREVRSQQGVPKAPTVARTGKIRTIKSGGKSRKQLQTNVTRSNSEQTTPTGVGSLFNENFRGRTETWVYRNLNELRSDIWRNLPTGLPDWVSYGMIEIRFTERLNVTDKVGSDQLVKNGYASITPFYSKEDFVDYVDKTGSLGDIPNPWDVAIDNLQNYDMTGPTARVYLYLAEKG
jgi:hypothetical protein